MKLRRWLLVSASLAALTSGCAPPGATGGAADQTSPQPGRVLVIIARYEPTSLSLKEVPAGQSNAGLISSRSWPAIRMTSVVRTN